MHFNGEFHFGHERFFVYIAQSNKINLMQNLLFTKNDGPVVDMSNCANFNGKVYNFSFVLITNVCFICQYRFNVKMKRLLLKNIDHNFILI